MTHIIHSVSCNHCITSIAMQSSGLPFANNTALENTLFPNRFSTKLLISLQLQLSASAINHPHDSVYPQHHGWHGHFILPLTRTSLNASGPWKSITPATPFLYFLPSFYKGIQVLTLKIPCLCLLSARGQLMVSGSEPLPWWSLPGPFSIPPASVTSLLLPHGLQASFPRNFFSSFQFDVLSSHRPSSWFLFSEMWGNVWSSRLDFIRQKGASPHTHVYLPLITAHSSHEIFI